MGGARPAILGLAGTAGIVVAGAVIAARLFGGDLPGNTTFLLPLFDAAGVALLVIGISAAAAFLAAREAARTDPGAVFRET